MGKAHWEAQAEEDDDSAIDQQALEHMAVTRGSKREVHGYKDSKDDSTEKVFSLLLLQWSCNQAS